MLSSSMIFTYDNILVFGATPGEDDQALRHALGLNFNKSWYNLWSMVFSGIGRIARLQDRPQSQAPFLFFAGANGNFINGFLQVTTQQKRPYKTGRTISVDIRVPESTQANIEVLSGVTVMGYFSRYLEGPNSSCTQGRPRAGCCILVTCLLRALTDTHASRRKPRLLWGAYSLTP